MSQEIESASQNKILLILKKSTPNILSAFIWGILICLVTQSSSIVTILAISLIAANTLSLEKGLAIMIGSNIGTTLTSLFLSFNLSYIYYLFILLGTIPYMFKQRKASFLFWLGLIFLSLDLIESSLITLFDSNFIQNIILKYNTQVAGTISGMITSFLIQSSSTTIILAQKLYENNLISGLFGVSVMLGANIGTTINGLLFSLNSTINGKRLALGGLLFNIFGVVIVFPLLYIKDILTLFNHEYLISVTHIYFNVVTGIIGIFLIKPLCFLINYIIR